MFSVQLTCLIQHFGAPFKLKIKMAWVNPRDGHNNINAVDVNNIMENSFIQKQIIENFKL